AASRPRNARTNHSIRPPPPPPPLLDPPPLLLDPPPPLEPPPPPEAAVTLSATDAVLFAAVKSLPAAAVMVLVKVPAADVLRRMSIVSPVPPLIPLKWQCSV